VDRSSKNHEFVDRVAETNVRRTVQAIRKQSPVLKKMEDEKAIVIVGGMYDVETGEVRFFESEK
jgi:carbonic anhydrase